MTAEKKESNVLPMYVTSQSESEIIPFSNIFKGMFSYYTKNCFVIHY